jgi:hypothetical protein
MASIFRQPSTVYDDGINRIERRPPSNDNRFTVFAAFRGKRSIIFAKFAEARWWHRRSSYLPSGNRSINPIKHSRKTGIQIGHLPTAFATVSAIAITTRIIRTVIAMPVERGDVR